MTMWGDSATNWGGGGTKLGREILPHKLGGKTEEERGLRHKLGGNKAGKEGERWQGGHWDQHKLFGGKEGAGVGHCLEHTSLPHLEQGRGTITPASFWTRLGGWNWIHGTISKATCQADSLIVGTFIVTWERGDSRESHDFQLVSRSHLQCSWRLTCVLVLLKNLIFFLKRFPSFTRWALSGSSHNPSSDLSKAKVGQWPALFTFCKIVWNLSHYPTLRGWVLKMKKKTSCLSYSWLWALHSWECQKSLQFWKL